MSKLNQNSWNTRFTLQLNSLPECLVENISSHTLHERNSWNTRFTLQLN